MTTTIQISAGNLHVFGLYSFPLHLAVLVMLLLIATTVDLRERRIPNWLVAAGMVIGILFHMIVPQGMGTSFSLSGLGIGIVTLFPLFALSAMGAGDVKMMGMVGAFLGSTGVLGALLASFVAGGVLALGMAIHKRLLPQLLANLRVIVIQHYVQHMSGASAGSLPPPPSVGKMPYALAICAGTLFQLFVME